MAWIDQALEWWSGQSFGGGRWLRHAEYLDLYTNVNCTFSEAGTSIEGRKIREYTWGTGSRSAVLWSQMHGNEATATYALHDLLLYLGSFSNLPEVSAIRERIHMRVLPMVNPDGAEYFSRRTAIGIDPNRDAKALQCVETRILLDRIRRSGAEVAFNLHDQRNIFHLENTKDSAIISFLAPSTDVDRSTNPTRKLAMNWVSHLQKQLKTVHAPGAGKYSDEYYPTAFGETVQGLGIPTVLIESGGAPGDPDRLLARKLNFYLLLHALHALAYPEVKDHYTRMDYDAIPLNASNQWDVLIRDVRIQNGAHSAVVNLGILYDFHADPATGKLRTEALIGDIGDLYHHCGLQSWSAGGALYENGKRLPRLKEQASFTLTANDGFTIHVDQGLRV